MFALRARIEPGRSLGCACNSKGKVAQWIDGIWVYDGDRDNVVIRCVEFYTASVHVDTDRTEGKTDLRASLQKPFAGHFERIVTALRTRIVPNITVPFWHAQGYRGLPKGCSDRSRSGTISGVL